MVKIQTNIGVITEKIKAKLSIIKDKEYLLRGVCFDIIDKMTKRIHVDGRASDDTPIGTYSEGYMAIRTGAFKNAKKKTAGTFTDRTIRLDKKTGVFSGEDKVGKARPNYNRGSDTKVVISLTRQLENDWSVIATDKGYGIGFLNKFNLQKARWTEETYDKKIFNLSASESEHAITTIQTLIRKALNE